MLLNSSGRNVVLLLWLVVPCVFAGNEVEVDVSVDTQNRVHVRVGTSFFPPAGSCMVYRSNVNLGLTEVLDMNEVPITKNVLPMESNVLHFVDSMCADNCLYYYYIEVRKADGTRFPCRVQSVYLTDKTLPLYTNKSVALFVDKLNYFLEVRYDGIGVKRYPVNMGQLPHNRKLCFDRRSTPEGIYKAVYLWPNATFYKAIGVSYPNKTDYRRYRLAINEGRIQNAEGKVPSIGGSIQIHGGGIGRNWTWGCIAMRNEDIDDLFTIKVMKVGTPIYIVGKEVTREEIEKGVFAGL